MRTLLIGVALLGACASTHRNPPSSSNAEPKSTASDAFKVCRSEDECGSELECFCGICTSTCDEDRDCSALTPRAVCAKSIPITPACASPGAPIRVHPACAIACDSDEDCHTALGHAARCSAEWCRLPVAPGVLDGSDTRSCADREEQLRRIIAPALDAADRSCASAGDCMVTSAVNACYGDECMFVFMSRAGVESLRAALSQLESQYCDEVFEAGCAGPGQRPSCPRLGVPACIDGQCREVR